MTDYERQELEPATVPLKRGARGPKVRQVQEWLTLHGLGVAIDGDFGPATEEAVKLFQARNMNGFIAPDTSGCVGWYTWEFLTAQLRNAVCSPEWFHEGDAGTRIVAIAEHHLRQGPREVGGPNGGSWVRWYMKGKEGRAYPWCAGFVTTILRQALGHSRWDTFSCDELALKALGTAAFLRAPGPSERSQVAAGDVFLLRHPAPEGISLRPDWYHTGIVTRVEPGGEAFHTAEGNTTAGGSPEGTCAMARVRAFNEFTDFIRMGVARGRGE